MKTIRLLLLSVIVTSTSYAQFIGQANLTLVDSARSNRNVPIELYYPATSAGINTPPASGTFALITIGHGFVMGIDAYKHFADTLVPQGYAIALVNTETSFSPSHATFGADLLFVNNHLKTKSQNDGAFILYQKLSSFSAIGGHSMGGGATMLAAATAQPGEITTIFGLAAAETTPSAINACTQIQIPAIIFAGSADGVTPNNEHQIPMYDSLASTCKYYVEVIGGAHCYFAKPNAACDFGESVSSTGITVTRGEQQQIMFKYLKPWLSYHLNGNSAAITNIYNSLTADAEVSFVRSCGTLSVSEVEGKDELNFKWKMMDHKLYIDLSEVDYKNAVTIEILNTLGELVNKITLKPTDPKQTVIDLSSWPKSLYILSVKVGKQTNCSKFALP